MSTLATRALISYASHGYKNYMRSTETGQEDKIASVSACDGYTHSLIKMGKCLCTTENCVYLTMPMTMLPLSRRLLFFTSYPPLHP